MWRPIYQRSFANAEEVCFVVAMAKLERVEGTGNFPPSPHRNTELLADSPTVMGSIGAGLVLDSLGSILGESLLPL
jgi:hypothetical protein